MIIFFLACFFPNNSSAQQVDQLIGDSDRPKEEPTKLVATNFDSKNLLFDSKASIKLELKKNILSISQDVALPCDADIKKDLSISLHKNQIKAIYSNSDKKDCNYKLTFNLDTSSFEAGKYTVSAHGVSSSFQK